MKRRARSTRGQRGAGLIDVLLAMSVLSGAVASLAQLQAFTFRECAEARLRSVAILLARAKLDDLRAFSQLAAGPAGVFSFDEIGAASGGTEDGDGGLRLPAGAVSVDGVRFDRSWTAAPRPPTSRARRNRPWSRSRSSWPGPIGRDSGSASCSKDRPRRSIRCPASPPRLHRDRCVNREPPGPAGSRRAR